MENVELEARLRDAAQKAERGAVATLPFLTPRERRVAERTLSGWGVKDRVRFWGGYPEAERVCLFFLPDYLSAYIGDGNTVFEQMREVPADDIADAVCALRIKGSGYRVLTHRDYLGSILALGLERDALGDIVVQNDGEAVLFTSRTIASFLCEELTHVANDAVRVEAYCPDASFTDGRRYRSVDRTVASPRLDCVVAALTDLSREEAQKMIRSGLVEADFEPVLRVDFPVTPPIPLSVRGYGRYRLLNFDGETRKGRLRLRAEQLV